MRRTETRLNAHWSIDPGPSGVGPRSFYVSRGGEARKKAQSRSFTSELVISMWVALSSFTPSLHFIIVCKLQSFPINKVSVTSRFIASSFTHTAMTEGQSTPQQGPPAALAQAPLKAQKITDIIDTFRPSKVGSS